MNKTGQKKSSLALPIDESTADWLKSTIRDIPDFPKPGVVFKDITTLLQDGEALSVVISVLTERCNELNPDAIAGIEARGFILGPAVAHALNIGFVPIRKSGKLPYKVESITYDLEYGKDTVEVHVDAVKPGEKVVIIDDLLATGGTAGAAYKLMEKLGAKVAGIGFIVELEFLNGRKNLPTNTDVFSILQFK